MSVLQRGGRLVVSELSRLGRSLGQIVATLDALTRAGASCDDSGDRASDERRTREQAVTVRRVAARRQARMEAGERAARANGDDRACVPSPRLASVVNLEEVTFDASVARPRLE